MLKQVNDAAAGRKTIEIVYYTMSRKKETRRSVDPYRIWFFNGTFYLSKPGPFFFPPNGINLISKRSIEEKMELDVEANKSVHAGRFYSLCAMMNEPGIKIFSPGISDGPEPS